MNEVKRWNNKQKGNYLAYFQALHLGFQIDRKGVGIPKDLQGSLPIVLIGSRLVNYFYPTFRTTYLWFPRHEECEKLPRRNTDNIAVRWQGNVCSSITLRHLRSHWVFNKSVLNKTLSIYVWNIRLSFHNLPINTIYESNIGILSMKFYFK